MKVGFLAHICVSDLRGNKGEQNRHVSKNNGDQIRSIIYGRNES